MFSFSIFKKINQIYRERRTILVLSGWTPEDN